MNQWMQRYIEIKKNVDSSDYSPQVIKAFYALKDELEQEDSLEAKDVLAYVCASLLLYKNAYQALVAIPLKKHDKKMMLRFASIKERCDAYGNAYAIPHPKQEAINK